MLLTVCIPMYNEAEIVSSAVIQLTEALEKAAPEHGFEYEIIFSDDGSADNCKMIAEDTVRTLSLKSGEVKVVRSDVNMGKGHAVRLAVKHSKGDIVLYTDCDLAYGVDVIPEAYDIMTKEDFGGDVLIGSRSLREDGYEGYTFMRKLASKVYIKVLCTIAGFKLTDSQCGFKAFKGETARKVFSYATINGWAFDFEILMTAQKLGYKIKEFPVKIINHRESKIHLFGDSIRMLRDLMKIKKHVKKNVK